ncbi:MAG: hypothetical protein M1479_08580 [Actinobacteria bacterium]|nr:hypothetical protein [Actinomycetota bacterium]
MKMIGIVDEFGIDSFMPLEDNYKQAFIFFIRSKLSLNRSVTFFCLDFTEKEISKINNIVSSHEVKQYNEAGIMIFVFGFFYN